MTTRRFAHGHSRTKGGKKRNAAKQFVILHLGRICRILADAPRG